MPNVNVLELAHEFYTLNLLSAISDTWDCYTYRSFAAKRDLIHNRYNQYADGLATFFTDYLTLACMGEGRHSVEYCPTYFIPQLWNKAQGRKYERCYSYTFHTKYNRESMLEALVYVFGEDWKEQNMGGDSWALIAQTTLDFIKGEYPRDVFIDRVWDLRHNGGRLFDKPTSDELGFSIEEEGNLIQFLDLKRNCDNLFKENVNMRLSSETCSLLKSLTDIIKPCDSFWAERAWRTDFDLIYNYKPIQWGAEKVDVIENTYYEEDNDEDDSCDYGDDDTVRPLRETEPIQRGDRL
jgi:hypothetical protein